MAFKVLKQFDNKAKDEFGVSVVKIDTPLALYDFDTKQPYPIDISYLFGKMDSRKIVSYFGCVIEGHVDFIKPYSAYNTSVLKKVSNLQFFSGYYTDLLVKPHSRVCIIQLDTGYQAPSVVGDIESRGRLKYIDGAYNSLLMSPPKKGDPCLNALYMAGKIDQTPHTHPSTRIGAILRGSVTVRIWDKEGEGASVIQEHLLQMGDVWFMDRDTVHSFHTEESDDMALFAFHPDSDFGPTDEEAPMINRTLIEGVSAKGNNEPGKKRGKNKPIQEAEEGSERWVVKEELLKG